jgi:ribosomal protein S21
MTQVYEEITLDEIAVVDNPANPGARAKLAKRLDPKDAKDAALRRFKKRVDKSLVKAKVRFHEELAAIERGQPIKKAKKKRKPVVVDEDQYETGDRQPPRIGPQAHSNPPGYPTSKRERALQKQFNAYLSNLPWAAAGRRTQNMIATETRCSRRASRSTTPASGARSRSPLMAGRPHPHRHPRTRR